MSKQTEAAKSQPNKGKQPKPAPEPQAEPEVLSQQPLEQVGVANQATFQAFEVLVYYIHSQQIAVKPGLVIPLTAGDIYLQADVPANLEDINRQLDDEPPSLYLLDWEAMWYPAPNWKKVKVQKIRAESSHQIHDLFTIG